MQLHQLLEEALLGRAGQARGLPLALRRAGAEQVHAGRPRCTAASASTAVSSPTASSTSPSGTRAAYVSINVAALDNLDPAELLAAPVQFCDGQADNWWNPPAETRHL